MVITAGVPLGIWYHQHDESPCGRAYFNFRTWHYPASNLWTALRVQYRAGGAGTLKDGDILVIPFTSNKLMPILKNASGIITEEDGTNSHAAIAGMAMDIPVIVGAENATKF